MSQRLLPLVACHDNIASYQEPAYYADLGFNAVVFEGLGYGTGTPDPEATQTALDAVGVELIPEVQGLGHHGPAALDPEALEVVGQTATCPALARTYERVYQTMAKVINQDTKRIHIGCDEVRYINLNSACLATGKTNAELYAAYVRGCYRMARHFNSNIQVMMWADNMQPATQIWSYLKVTEALAHIPKEVILCMWNYGYDDYDDEGNWFLNTSRLATRIPLSIQWARHSRHKFTGSPRYESVGCNLWMSNLKNAYGSGADCLGVIATNWGGSRAGDAIVTSLAYGD
uniref:Beta-N-acetylhexosaminidase n=1 Tax=viral metagenome TaxID=1070528 RepID=A0A6M3L719_9ZZZZ